MFDAPLRLRTRSRLLSTFRMIAGEIRAKALYRFSFLNTRSGIARITVMMIRQIPGT
jgi:hypothetical protein